jgi:Tyrosine-protein kinase ephrin type A/B receptor-like
MCPQGTIAPEPCPKGTYGIEIGTMNCLDCPGGKYCDEFGMSDDTFNEKYKLCDPGYFCFKGSQTPHPMGTPNGAGDICPPGHYCIAGSSQPTPCPAGTFETRSGSYEC